MAVGVSNYRCSCCNLFWCSKQYFIANPFGGVISLNNPAIYYFFYILYFLVFLNSLNWLDGTDGLAGGVTLASLATIFFLSFKPEVNQPAVAILCVIAGGAVLGFLVFNFNPAKILAGTSGAWFFGFILASLSIFAGAKIATVMMAVLIPILDLRASSLGKMAIRSVNFSKRPAAFALFAA